MGSAAQRQRQMAEAEELFGERLEKAGFAKGLYFGEYKNEKLLPYPDIHAHADTNRRVEELTAFCQAEVDPVAIDRNSEIPRSVIDGLGRLGVLGACMPKEHGGSGLSQTDYCRLLEVLGRHCGSTALFVNAHHSIGPRALVLFGTPEQQEKWIPPMASGEWISAFALTEPEAGSDAANVQTTADPTPDGKGYILNGEKRWITNGAVARMLIVMARTPVPGSSETKITAFQVDSAWPGFEVVEASMDKMGVRGTATARLRFNNLFVPNENILGQLGKGLKIALTVLDFGRTTFGATCTGAAKFCCERSVEHALRRVQFGQKLASFELVKEKIAYMQAGAYAMEAMTYQTAALIDSGEDDYMLETAMLKVFNTEVLWRILNDTFQLHGGMAYFTDQPFERMLRDARINTIGEGSNDVLRSFIALVGMRDVGLELQSILAAVKQPVRNLGQLSSFAGKKLERMFSHPHVRVLNSELELDAISIGRLTSSLGSHVTRLLGTYQEEILDRQYQLARVADVATQLYACGCVLSRLDRALGDHHLEAEAKNRELALGRHYLLTAKRRIQTSLASCWDNDDRSVTRIADLALGLGK
jgi:alkylation response protein AidB-like acyl-CoA dehydrogenase